MKISRISNFRYVNDAKLVWKFHWPINFNGRFKDFEGGEHAIVSILIDYFN